MCISMVLFCFVLSVSSLNWFGVGCVGVYSSVGYISSRFVLCSV